MQRLMSLKYEIPPLILLFMIIFLYTSSFPNGVVGVSSSFARQEIEDGGNDWIYSINASYASTNITSFSGIETVSYSSDGKFLNATLWLTSPFEEKPSASALHYLMYIDVDSNNKTGYTGADYAVGIRWDNHTGTWFREFLEFSLYNKMKVVTEEKVQTGFFDVEKNSVYLSLDLTEVNSPNHYSVAFSIEDFIKGIYDTTSWLPIPPPEFDIVTFPSSLILRPGDEKTIELRVNSTTNLQPEVLLHMGKNTKDMILDINPNRTVIPSHGWTTSELHIKVLQNAQQSRTHTFPIFVDAHFPLERLNTKGMTINKTSYLTITVLPALTIPQYIGDLLSVWGSPVKELIGIITTIGSLGVGGWILNKIRKKRQKNEDKSKKTE
jgi:hypothetical protein